MSWVVALETKMKTPRMDRQHDVEYLGVRDQKGTPDPYNWWWVAPGKAAAKVGQLDYTRFEDVADAVAHCLVVQDFLEEKCQTDPHGRWDHKKVFIREIG